MPTPYYSFLDNDVLREHGRLICRSYQRYTGKTLSSCELDPVEPVIALFEAPFALVSHGIEEDPIFNFANRTALELFEVSWSQCIRLPSRMSAEAVNRVERQRLLDRVTRHGYVDDYRGVRISSTGRKFLIENAAVWNIVDDRGRYHGQAAAFSRWSYLES